MWLLVRLAVFVVVFLSRWAYRASAPATVRTLNGRAAHAKIERDSKTEQIENFAIGVSLPAPLLLSMTREDTASSLLKSLGLCRDVETGDGDFDCLVHVACDHPELHDFLTEDADARAAIRLVFEAGFMQIKHDGAVLWIHRKSSSEPSDADWDLLGVLAATLTDLESRCKSRRVRYTVRSTLCEATAGAIFAFGMASLFPAFSSMRWSLDRELTTYGLVAAAVLFLLLTGSTVLLLRGSSRLRVVLTESCMMLALGLPTACIQSTADINARAGEVSRSEVVRTIARTELIKRRNIPSYYAQTVSFDASSGAVDSWRIRITSDIYEQVVPGDRLRVTVARGALGLRWIDGFAIESKTRTP